MLYVTTDFTYKNIEESLKVICPWVKIQHIYTDNKLKELGFVESPPCCFSLDMSWDEFEYMMDELTQLEVDAFNTPHGEMPSKNDPLYQKYIKYGWLWNMFYNADVKEEQ